MITLMELTMTQIKLLIFVLVLSGLTACSGGRRPASEELPAVQPSGVPAAAGDEVPVVKTVNGYTLAPIPGVDTPPPPPLIYQTFSGASN